MMETEKEYAVALFSVATEEGTEKEVFSDLLLVEKLVKDAPEYLSLLSSPALSLKERKALLNEAFSSLSENVLSFLGVICENGRMPLLLQIIGEYERLHRSAGGEIRALVTSAVELTEDQKKSVVEKLEAKLSGKVFALFERDPSLIGGIKVEAEGVTFDGSVKKRLNEMKEVMIG